jgi:hypothetical protein
VKKYTATVDIPDRPKCHHNNAHDRIEYIEPVSHTSSTLTVKVGFIPQHSGAYTWMWGWELNCWQFTDGYVAKVYDHKGPPTKGSPFLTKQFTFTPQMPEHTNHWLRCGLIDLWYTKQGFKNGKFCAARDAGSSMWKDHHYDNADMPFTMGGGYEDDKTWVKYEAKCTKLSGDQYDCQCPTGFAELQQHVSHESSLKHKCEKTPAPTSYPTPNPTPYPTSYPTTHPTDYPTPYPTPYPTSYPTSAPTPYPTPYPTSAPTGILQVK